MESGLAHRGFLSRIEDGKSAAFATRGNDSEEAVERLVEVLQAELWGGRVPATDLIATYEHACEARGHAVAAISEDDVEAIRARVDDLSERWSALGVNEALVLHF